MTKQEIIARMKQLEGILFEYAMYDRYTYEQRQKMEAYEKEYKLLELQLEKAGE